MELIAAFEAAVALMGTVSPDPTIVERSTRASVTRTGAWLPVIAMVAVGALLIVRQVKRQLPAADDETAEDAGDDEVVANPVDVDFDLYAEADS